MNKKEAIDIFVENELGAVPPHDEPALAEAWNYFTDSLCKDGKITSHQYSTWTHPKFSKHTHLSARGKYIAQQCKC